MLHVVWVQSMSGEALQIWRVIRVKNRSVYFLREVGR